MKIERSETFILSEVIWRENILTPNDGRDEVSNDFIRCYKANNFCLPSQNHLDDEILITIALCRLEEKEDWKTVSAGLKKDGWSGGSLFFWNLYVQDKKVALTDAVILPGILYRDDEVVEWIPVVHHRPIVSMFGDLRGSETKISMKPSMVLGLTKPHTLLISKTEVLKT